ncbi:DUF6575 domain-containing protein [Kitasatospora sp. NPDC096204]|uniref:DUF6575 domain-containing protein n=1 Tax=Kitasatospora sp. NPDC096204 TaxID=3364094 RepID=UPI0038229348
MPEKTILGDLKILETYVFHDGPRVFSCISLTDQIYLGPWAAEGADGDDWLYLPISKSRLEMVRSGVIALRTAVKRPEGFTFRAFLPHHPGSQDLVDPIPPSEIPEEWLPEGGYCLDLATHTLPLADPESVIETKARQESRTRLRLRSSRPSSPAARLPPAPLGHFSYRPRPYTTTSATPCARSPHLSEGTSPLMSQAKLPSPWSEPLQPASCLRWRPMNSIISSESPYSSK